MQQRIIVLSTMFVSSLSLQALQQVKVAKSLPEELEQKLCSERTAALRECISQDFALRIFMKFYEQDHGEIAHGEFSQIRYKARIFAEAVLAYYIEPYRTMLKLSPKLLLLIQKHGAMFDHNAFFGKGERKLTIAATALGATTVWYLAFINIDEVVKDEKILSTIIIHAEEILDALTKLYCESPVKEICASINDYVCKLDDNDKQADEEEEKSNHDETEQDDPQNL